MEKQEVAKMLDHTLLKADATHEQLRAVCNEAKQYGVAAVCVNSLNAYFVHKELKGSGVKTCVVVGFPLGATASAAKAFEAACAIEDGAEEIDMVIDIASAKEGNWRRVEDDIATVLDACDGRALLKVIIECCLLTDEEKIKLCEVVSNSHADYIKTSTGFAGGGATREDVALMVKHMTNGKKVKAAGGIGSLQDAEDFLNLGADRLGTSRIVKAVKELEAKGQF